MLFLNSISSLNIQTKLAKALRYSMLPLVALIAALGISLLGISASHALGIGSVATKSFVGERFSATIPVFSINNPESLVVELTNVPNDISGQPLLRASIDNDNGQFLVRISSERPTNDLHLSFGLQLSDQQQTLNKEFTVLIDMAQPSSLMNGSTIASGSSTPYDTNTTASISNARPDLMGPYEWAERGNVPRRFGAVIDGQSLWRVARRINSAMGVSINQMMWGLYTLNPDAFSSKSIDSLQAGTYLDIPSFSQVTQFSDAQAKQKVDGTMSFQSTSTTESQTEYSDSEVGLSDENLGDSSREEPVANSEKSDELITQDVDDSFQLTGINEVPGSSGLPADNEDMQEVISSLSVTVGNLTQEVFLKDKKIDYLEERISSLEGVLELDSLVQNSNLSENILADQPLIDATGLVTTSLADNGLLVGTVEPQKIEKTIAKPKPTLLAKLRPWVLWACAIISLILLFMILWPRLVALAAGLRLFGADERIDFDSESTLDSVSASDFSQPNDTDFSTMKILNKLRDDDSVEGISYLDFDADDEVVIDQSEIDENSRPTAIVLSATDVGTDFQKRFDDLIKRQLFGDARELLELTFADKGVDETVYHYKRLRLYFEQRDEEGFYTYYYEVEAEMPHFDEEVNRKISEMVILLGQVE